MTIKQLGGVFGRNPTFNNVTIEGTLTFDGDIDINSDLTIGGNLDVTGSVTADGLTVDGLAAISSTTPEIRMFETDTTDLNTQLRSGVGKFEIKTLNDAVTLATKRFELDHANGDISFYNDAAAQGLFWDSSASALGLGTTSPSSYFSPQLVVHSSTNLGGITIRSNATTDTNYLLFADGTSGNERYRGYVSYDHNSDTMKLATGASLAITIDSSQNLLVGTTSSVPASSGNVAGSSLLAIGKAEHSRADGVVLALNRKTSDGDIAKFYQDGAPVGSIGSAGGQFYIGNEAGSLDTGILFGETGTTARAILPSRADGTEVDGGLDIGRSAARWKDLFLSGGVVFGTTGGSVSSKTLDDYEEGTWTPVYAPTSGSFATMTMSTPDCFYTKVGRMVTVSGIIRTTDVDVTGASGSVIISGLPFAVESWSAISLGRVQAFGGDMPDSGYGGGSATNINLYYRASSNGATTVLNVTDLQDGTVTNANYIFLEYTYQTT